METTILKIAVCYDGQECVVELANYDETDDYQPYQFMLPSGELVWIPLEDLSQQNKAELEAWFNPSGGT